MSSFPTTVSLLWSLAVFPLAAPTPSILEHYRTQVLLTHLPSLLLVFGAALTVPPSFTQKKSGHCHSSLKSFLNSLQHSFYRYHLNRTCVFTCTFCFVFTVIIHNDIRFCPCCTLLTPPYSFSVFSIGISYTGQNTPVN